MKDKKTNWGNIILPSIVAAVMVLVADYLWGDKLSFIRHLTQGEVLTGIVIAFPAFVTWNMSITERRNSEREQSENERKKIAKQALEIVKHYDEQLYEVTNEVVENQELTLKRASKIVYIVETFEKLFKEINAEKETQIYLDYAQILVSICSIKYPKNLLESPQDSKVIEWKENLEHCLKPTLHNIVKRTGEIKVLDSQSVKYFSLIKFGEDINFAESLKLKDKVFVECVFSDEFIEKHDFNGCEFIDCKINRLYIDKLSISNSLQGELYNEEYGILDKDLINIETKQSAVNVIDYRENIIADEFIESGGYYTLKLENKYLDRKSVRIAIENELSIALGIEGALAKKISISRNYVTEDDPYPEKLWAGWHSMFKDQIDRDKNYKYYVFGVIKTDVCYYILFEKNSFIEFLNEKIVDKSGKYNFYFSGIKDDWKEKINENRR